MTCAPDLFSAASADSTSPSTTPSEQNQRGCASTTPTAEACSSSGSPASPSCPTCGNSTTPSDRSTSSTAATPASPSASPANDREPTTPAICGLSSRDSFAYYDPDSSSVRTCQATFDLGSPTSSPTLPPSGCMCGGWLYALPTSAPPTSALDSSSLLGTPSAADAMGGHLSRGGNRSHELLLKGQVKALLPTPASQEPGGTAEAHLWRKNRIDGANRVTPTHLAFISALLPTPNVQNARESGKPRDHRADMTAALSKLLPTPTGDDANNVTRESGEYQSLARTAHSLLPTPTGRDHKGRNQRDDATCLPGAIQLLPTPVVTDSFGSRNRTSGRQPDSNHHDGVTLTDAVWMAQGRTTDTLGQLLPTHRVSATRSSRKSMVENQQWSAPSLVQALEISQGILPREFNSWDEVPGWSGARTPQPSPAGSTSSDGPPHGQLTIEDA